MPNVDPKIAILTNRDDVTADFLVTRLSDRAIPYLRLDAESLLDAELTYSPAELSGVLKLDGVFYNLPSLCGVWLRRPSHSSGSDNLTVDELHLASREIVNAIWACLLLTPGPICWINPPDANERADYKLEQLSRAKAFGLATPETLMTSELAAAKEFLRSRRKVVVKAAYEGFAEIEGRQTVTWTTLIDEELLAGVTLAPIPMIFQQAITPKQDVRVTLIDDEVWAADITYEVPTARTSLDWRASPLPSISRPTRLDSYTELAIKRLAKSYGLRFAAIDLVIDETGSVFFLEINANGQWGWLEKECNFPLRDHLIDALLKPPSL